MNKNKNNPFMGKHGPLLIAEIGGNHEGNFEFAKKLTSLAIESGVDAVKFQLYRGDTIANKVVDPALNKHFKRFELKKEQHIELAKRVQSAGLQYIASVWDMEMLEWINPYIPIYKIGSGDLTAYTLLKRIALKGKPIILSTGLATEDEISDAVKHIQDVNNIYKNPNNFALLQCTSMYPIENSDTNLNVIRKLYELTGLTVGYSDHTVGHKALAYAFAVGANILEFHFTDKREGKLFRDHKVSLTKDEVLELISEIKLIESFLGSENKRPLEIEIENDHITSFRRAVYPIRDLPAAQKISEDDLIVLRPNVGIDARDFYKIIGKKTKKALKAFQKLDFKYFD